MASTSETGHAKNVAHFESLISFCTGYGASYNPTNTAIQLSALNTLLTNARDSLANVTVAKTAFKNATAARQETFDPLKVLCTRVVNALDATNTPQASVKQAKTILNKIRGRRSSSKPPTPAPGETVEDKTISVSQQSFDQSIEHFAALIELVSTQPAYTPNEPGLKVSGLTSMYNSLISANTAVIEAYTAYSNQLNARNAVLYATASGLVDVAGDAKKYVKSAFGATSSQFDQVSALAFRMVA